MICTDEESHRYSREVVWDCEQQRLVFSGKQVCAECGYINPILTPYGLPVPESHPEHTSLMPIELQRELLHVFGGMVGREEHETKAEFGFPCQYVGHGLGLPKLTVCDSRFINRGIPLREAIRHLIQWASTKR